MRYQAEYEKSIKEPEAFWREKTDLIAWFEKPKKILSEDANGFFRWYKGGKLNTAYLALGYHIENGRGDQTALIYDSPATNTLKKFNYRELSEQVSLFAGALTDLGVIKGDRVIIYMPMVPEAVIAMLACAHLGAVHSVVFGGFAPQELAIRIEDAKPKGIVRDNGGHAVALKYSMEAIYGVNAGDVYWAASDVGWVVGHSYIVYAPLLAGCTTILFEGKPVRTPDAGVFWRVMSEHKVKSFFTAPTAFRAIKKEDPEGKLLKQYDLSALKYLFLAGERLDPPTYHWLQRLLEVPIYDHWWQTETGWAIVANMAGVEQFPVKAGSATKAVCGYDVQILDEDGKEIGANQEGIITIKLPLPPGCLPTLWNDDERFHDSYLSQYDGYYLTGDGGYKDEEDYIFIMGRIDDVINVAGHRLSTGEMEEFVASHSAVAECAVFGVEDEMRGQIPHGLVVLKDGYENTDPVELEKELVQIIREKIGAFAYFRRAQIVKRLPKTRSGKILRNVMRKIADGKRYTAPSTIDDPAILDEIKAVLASRP